MRLFDRFGDRLFELAGEPADAAQQRKARFFQLFLLVHVSARMADWSLPLRSGDGGLRLALFVVAAVALLAGLRSAWARAACAVVAGVLFFKLAYTFPHTSNHFFLELCFMTLLGLLDVNDAKDRALLLALGRSLVAIVLFYTGLQKLFYGTYFDGQFLGLAVARSERFAAFFQYALPAAEFARLTALDFQPGAGPFSVQAPLFVVASNLVWIFELCAPFFLIWPRTRTLAALAASAFTLALQAGARELMFGALFVNLLLLFPRPAWNRLLLPGFALGYVVLMTIKLSPLEWYWN